MPQARVDDVTLEWAQTGDPDAPLVLLIAGMGAQLTMWPRELIERIANAGYRVVAFDNRDSGLSSGFEHAAPARQVREALAGRAPLPIAYSVADMMRDALGLLDALDAPRAHVVGMSMGGVIGQRLAIHHPARVASFVQIASTTGEPHLPGPDPRIGALLAGADGTPPDRETALERAVEFLQLLAGTAYARDRAELYAAAAHDYDRNRHPEGALRQMVAVMTEPPRGAALTDVTTPTLVIHGTDDLMVPLAAGEDTAARITGARLEVVPGMGHNIEPKLAARLAASIVAHAAFAESRSAPPR
jgi:proline iminopeptidase